MQRTFLVTMIAGIFCVLAATAQGQQEKNRLWLTWENRSVDHTLCRSVQRCEETSRYITRLIETAPRQKAQGWIDSLSRLARARGMPEQHPQAPVACRIGQQAPITTAPPLSARLKRLAPLIALPGVFVEVTKLKAPAGYKGKFGEQLQKEITQRLRKSGIKVLDRKQMMKAPGQPHLKFYLENQNKKTGCSFFVVTKLEQTMLLGRNSSLELKVGTWQKTGGRTPDAIERGEYGEIMFHVNHFIKEYWIANTPRRIAKSPQKAAPKK